MRRRWWLLPGEGRGQRARGSGHGSRSALGCSGFGGDDDARIRGDCGVEEVDGGPLSDVSHLLIRRLLSEVVNKTLFFNVNSNKIKKWGKLLYIRKFFILFIINFLIKLQINCTVLKI